MPSLTDNPKEANTSVKNVTDVQLHNGFASWLASFAPRACSESSALGPPYLPETAHPNWGMADHTALVSNQQSLSERLPSPENVVLRAQVSATQHHRETSNSQGELILIPYRADDIPVQLSVTGRDRTGQEINVNVMAGFRSRIDEVIDVLEDNGTAN
jgi:hypothetical protein